MSEKFEPPFEIEDFPQVSEATCTLIVRDAGGTALTYTYGDDRQTGDLKKLSIAKAKGVARGVVAGLTMLSKERGAAEPTFELTWDSAKLRAEVSLNAVTISVSDPWAGSFDDPGASVTFAIPLEDGAALGAWLVKVCSRRPA